MGKWIAFAGGFLALCAWLFWWLLLDGKASESDVGLLEVDEAVALVAAGDPDNFPISVRVEIVGTDVAPGFAAEVGNFGKDYKVAYTAFQIEWADGRSIVIGGAVDETFALETARSPDEATFDADAYQRLITAYDRADAVYITHGHSDHMIAIARHAEPEMLAERLRLTSYQRDALAPFAPGGTLPADYVAIDAIDHSGPTVIASGVVLIPTPGHSPTSQTFYVRLRDDREFLLIGDIVWKVSNIETLKTRPRILQYVLFDPDEDRSAVLSQIAQLANVREWRPEITILPNHDLEHIQRRVEQGVLERQFEVPSP